VFILVGIAASAACARIELTISSRGISYRGVTYSAHIPRADIVAIHAGMMRLSRRYSYFMRVKTLPNPGVDGLQIPIKPFRLDERRRFYEIAEQLQIPVRLGAFRRRRWR
jgi:hypothetical protein